jgi:hypothetical protein
MGVRGPAPKHPALRQRRNTAMTERTSVPISHEAARGLRSAMKEWAIRRAAKPGEPPDWRSVPTWEAGGGVEIEPNYFCRGANSKRKKYCERRAGAGTDHKGQGRCKSHFGNNPERHSRYSVIKRPRIRELVAQFATDQNPLDTLPEIHLVRALLVDGIERYDEITEAALAWHASFSAAMRPIHPRLVEALEVVLDELEALVGPFEVPGMREEPEAQPHGGWLRRRAQDDAEGEEAVATAYTRARVLLDALRTPPELKPRKMPDLSDLHALAESATRMVERVQRARSAMYITRPDFFRIMSEMGRVVELSNAIEDPEQRSDAIRDGWKAIRLA